jgi:hypothetical protein
MNLKYLSTLFILAFILLSFESSFAQNGLKGRHNIKASYSSKSYILYGNINYFQLEYNRGLTKFIEAGVYLNTHRDFYPVLRTNPVNNEPTIITLANRSLHYGIQTNIHPLQIFISEGYRFRLDLYFNAKIGGYYSPVSEESLREQVHFLDYSIGVGLGYHFFKHWGLFGEYNYRMPASFRYGLSIKF